MPRTLIIGDIHGCWEELQELLDRAGLSAGDTILSVGDLVDRGPDPGPVVAFFRDGIPREVAGSGSDGVVAPDGTIRRVICGNHERKHIRGILSFSQQIARLQLMWAAPSRISHDPASVAAAGARYADAVRWMGALPFHAEEPGYRAVHWGMFPGTPLADTPEDVRAGTTSGDAKLRERYGDQPWYERYTDDLPVAFGHAVVGDEPLILRDRVYGLDTGCCHGGWLTGLILPERRIVRVKARGDGWARSRAEWQVPVMKDHDWPGMTWPQLRKQLDKLRDPEADAAATIAEILAWITAVAALIPALADRLDAELARLQAEFPEDAAFGQAAQAHPAGGWLLRHKRGRLSRERLGCESPAQVLALAAALGVDHKVPARP